MATTPPPISQFIGNRALLDALFRVVDRQTFSHAYLFLGPAGVGKTTAARLFLQSILCHHPQQGRACAQCASCTAWHRGMHPDAVTTSPAGAESLTIAAVRSLQQRLVLRPTLSTHRAALIDDADKLTLEAANALLKTLEEPPAHTVIVLVTSAPELLPATVISRCQNFRFSLVRRDALTQLLRIHVENAGLRETYVRLAQGRPAWALALASSPTRFSEYRKHILQLLNVFAVPAEERPAALQRLAPQTRSAAAARQQTSRVLASAILLGRDMLFMRLGVPENVLHRFAAEKIRRVANRWSAWSLHLLLARTMKLHAALEQNLNPQLALENFSVHV